jgi:hypothetical protein
VGEDGNLKAVRAWLSWPGAEDPDRVIEGAFDERCDYYPARRFAEAEPCHGRTAVIAYAREFWQAWETWEMTVADVETIDAVRVLAQLQIRAVGRGSGVELDGALFQCFWFRNSRILRLEDHLTEAGARKALGLASPR